MDYEVKNLSVKTAPDGAIDSLSINGKPFSGFPGLLTASPGIHANAVWSTRGNHLVCTLELQRISGKAEDGASVSFRVPYQAMQYKMRIWTARKGYPKDIWDIGGTNLYYGDLCFGTLIPAVTLYDPVTNAGLTVAKAPGRTGGRFSFRFEDYHGTGMYVEATCLQVSEREPVKVTLLFYGHEGCWRPGLRWYLEEYPEFFEPAIPEVYSYPSFAITNAFTDPGYLKKYRPDWVEIHNHFPFYGDYLPDEEEWTSVIAHDYPQIAAERNLVISRQRLHEHFAELHRENIRAMYYFQCSGDSYIPWAEKNFPNDIARDAGGHTIPTWQDCIMGNADPENDFGKFVRGKIDRLLEVYPEIDGIFADQICYQTIDWAHNDGKTAADGRFGYEYGISIEKNLKYLADKMHQNGKPVLGNGAFDMECAQHVDAIMCESSSGNHDSLKYLCLRKPMLIHVYPKSASTAEKIMRGCILTGAGWSLGGSSTLINPEWTPEVEMIYQHYLPLAKAVFGAEILLTPDPIKTMPEDSVLSEVFKSRKNQGEYFVSVVFQRDSLLPTAEVRVRLPEECNKAEIMTIAEPEWKPFAFTREDDRLCLSLSGNIHACVIRFTK